MAFCARYQAEGFFGLMAASPRRSQSWTAWMISAGGGVGLNGEGAHQEVNAAALVGGPSAPEGLLAGGARAGEIVGLASKG